MSTEAESKPAERALRSDAERNRERILEAANELFAERGLTVSMDEIATRAGVGVGTVYRRFPDRDQLIDALFVQRMGLIVELADQALAHERAWDGIAFFLERAARLHHENRALRELLFGHQQGREWVDRGRAQMRPRIGRLVERAQAEGDLRADLEALDMPLMMMMLTAVLDYTAEADPEVWRRQLQVVLDGLRAERDAPTPLPGRALSNEKLATAMANWKSGAR